MATENITNQITSLMGNTSDSLIVKELLKLGSLVDTSSFGGIVRSIPSLLMKALGIALIKYMITNGGLPFLSKFFFSFIVPLLYRKSKLRRSDPKENAIITAVQKHITTKEENSNVCVQECNGIPIRVIDFGDSVVIENVPIIHSFTLTELYHTGTSAYETSLIPQDVQVVCKCGNERPFVPCKVYESRNCKMFGESVRSCFTETRCTDYTRTHSILIDGVPGLGKSMTVGYVYHNLAKELGIREIYYYDLSTTMRERKFPDIVNLITSKKVDHPTMYFIDEIDKYLDWQTESEYSKMVMENAKSKDPKGVMEKRQFAIDFKRNFMVKLLDMLSVNTFTKGVIFVFLSNNFYTMFEDLDPTHFTSFSRRFTTIRFEKCKVEELADYIRSYNEMFVDEEKYYVSKEEMEMEISRLNPDLEITYAGIQTCRIQSRSNLHRFVDLVNNYQELNLFEKTPGRGTSSERKKKEEEKEEEEDRGEVVTAPRMKYFEEEKPVDEKKTTKKEEECVNVDELDNDSLLAHASKIKDKDLFERALRQLDRDWKPRQDGRYGRLGWGNTQGSVMKYILFGSSHDFLGDTCLKRFEYVKILLEKGFDFTSSDYGVDGRESYEHSFFQHTVEMCLGSGQRGENVESLRVIYNELTKYHGFKMSNEPAAIRDIINDSNKEAIEFLLDAVPDFNVKIDCSGEWLICEVMKCIINLDVDHGAGNVLVDDVISNLKYINEKRNIDFSKKTINGAGILHFAVNSMIIYDLVDYLIQVGVELEDITPDHGNIFHSFTSSTIEDIIRESGEYCTASECVEYISRYLQMAIDKGVCIDGLPECKETPLMEAARHGDINAITLFLALGADPKAMRNGKCAMDVAANNKAILMMMQNYVK